MQQLERHFNPVLSPKYNPNFVKNSLSLFENPDRKSKHVHKRNWTQLKNSWGRDVSQHTTFTELLQQLREPDDWRRLRSGRYHSSSDLELATLATPQRDNRTRTSSLPPGCCWRQHWANSVSFSPPTTALREPSSPELVRSRPSAGSESPPPPRIPNHCTTQSRTQALPVPASRPSLLSLSLPSTRCGN